MARPRISFLSSCAFALTLGLASAPAVSAAQAKPVKAQTKPAAAPAALSSPDDNVAAEAAKALASGEADAWLARADAALAKSAADRTAALSRIAVQLAKTEIPAALKSYDAWAAAAQKEDLALLARIADGVLRQFEKGPQAELRTTALEIRARGGDLAARKTLEERKAAPGGNADSWVATLALARLGDKTATRTVALAVQQLEGSRRVTALAELRGVPTTPDVVQAIRLSLVEGDDMVRDAAADAATGRSAPPLIEPLKTVMQNARFSAPLRAAVALMQMGQDEGRATVDAALASPLADAKLLAARGYLGRKDTGWIASIEPVLEDANRLYRVFAAELLLPVRPVAATKALEPLLTDENPLLRAEAVRVIGLSVAGNLRKLRIGLGDANPSARFNAAQALVTANATPERR